MIIKFMRIEPRALPAARFGESTTVIEPMLVINSGRVVAKDRKTNPIRLLVREVFSQITSP